MAGPIAVAGTGALDVRATQFNTSAVGRSSAASMSVEKPSSSQRNKNTSWGFSFRYPLRSFWSGGKGRYDAIAVDDAVLMDEKEEKIEEKKDEEGQNGNWVLKILHVRSMRSKGDTDDVGDQGGGDGVEDAVQENSEGQNSQCGGGDEECDVCSVDDDEEKFKFDRNSFSRLLKKVSLAEARLYAQMSYLGSLAYSIPQIKPENLLRNHGLQFVTSSLEKKEQAEQALKAEKEKAEAEGQEKKENEVVQTQVEEKNTTNSVEGDRKTSGNRISASTAYHIAASAASYLHSHTKSIRLFKSSNSAPNKDSSPETTIGSDDNVVGRNREVASFMATSDSVTSVVAAKEEVKQAVADDLNSNHSSPCEWFVCDDDESLTRFFVIQGSESLASWQANLLFEPIQFEGLDVMVHRGIYEAAKGMYKQMLPEVRSHLKSHGTHAKFRFTGHSLGGSLSLLLNLMLHIRGEVPPSSLLPVITFGAPSIMCGGDRLLRHLGLPRSHLQAITMHRDIVPRAFSCNYPNHVAEFLKAINGNFRNHPCLNNQKLLFAPMGEFLILQPDDKFSPNHDLLPSGSGLYLMSDPVSSPTEAEKQVRAAQSVFLNSPHPLEILSDRSAYGSGGTIQRDHDMNSYLKSVRNVIRQELNSIRKARRKQRRRVWWPLVAPSGVNIVVRRHMESGNMGRGQFNFAGILHSGKESLKRFSTLVASQHMHLLVVLLFPARLLIVGTFSMLNFP